MFIHLAQTLLRLNWPEHISSCRNLDLVPSNTVSVMQDIVKARRQTSTYASKDVTFSSTREYKFLSAVIDARESEDEQALTDAAVDFDNVVKLDNWKTKVLLDIKNRIQEAGGDFR